MLLSGPFCTGPALCHFACRSNPETWPWPATKMTPRKTSTRLPEEDYEHLLEDYSHFAPPSEGEVLEGRVLKVTDQEVIVDFGYKSEGLVPIEQFLAAGRARFRAARRHDRRHDRPARARGRGLHTALARKGQPAARLGQPREGPSRRADGVRPRAGPGEGRPVGGCRRKSVHARARRWMCARFTTWTSTSARTFRSKS